MAKEIWYCEIGIADGEKLSPVADWPMRAAVQAAYFKLTGKESDYCASGWKKESATDYCASGWKKESAMNEYEYCFFSNASMVSLQADVTIKARCGWRVVNFGISIDNGFPTHYVCLERKI